ncbi:MAG: NAD(P)/FAD-dependent oxidoreductase, partial [Verrucomicrobiota bacterium]
MEPIHTDIVVVGAGPGGYAAAFYAADVGRKVLLVEQDKWLGGVCLNRGCIPSKALLYSTRMIQEARESAHRGITFAPPQIDLEKLRAWKNSIIEKLSAGVAFLAKKRGVQVLAGRGYFENSQTLRVETHEGQQLVNGGGYIGMELGSVYASLGSNIVVVEAMDTILGGADPDLVRPVLKCAQTSFRELRVNTKVIKMATKGKKILVVTEGPDKAPKEELFDRVLVSVGRVPRCHDLGLENTKVEQDERGFIKVNERQETADPAILAIGDIAGGVLLAHKATKEGRIAVDTIAGEPSTSAGVIIPAVVFTDPELAWCGLTEAEAKAKGIAHAVAKFPWSASGRALTFDRIDGLTKLIIDKETERILGVGIVGHGAGELISEGVVVIEMGGTVR